VAYQLEEKRLSIDVQDCLGRRGQLESDQEHMVAGGGTTSHCPENRLWQEVVPGEKKRVTEAQRIRPFRRQFYVSTKGKKIHQWVRTVTSKSGTQKNDAKLFAFPFARGGRSCRERTPEEREKEVD